MPRTLPLIVLAVPAVMLTLAGCASSPATPPRHAAPTPAASAIASAAASAVAAAIVSAAAADCASYRAVRSTIDAATAGDSTAGQLVTTIAGGGANVADTWTGGLTSAADRNDATVPAGHNAATQIAFKMSYVALGIGQTQVYADAGNAQGAKREWGLVTGGMSALDRACRGH